MAAAASTREISITTATGAVKKGDVDGPHPLRTRLARSHLRA